MLKNSSSLKEYLSLLYLKWVGTVKKAPHTYIKIVTSVDNAATASIQVNVIDNKRLFVVQSRAELREGGERQVDWKKDF